MEKPVLKLSQFLDIIKSQFDEIIWYHTYIIEAEIKSIKQVRQFYYIDLVEIDNWKIVDSTRANIFNPVVMTSFLREVNIWNIQDLVWKKLLLTVKPSFHKTYNFSVNIQHINTDFFIWWLEKKKKENIKDLKERWIFYNNKSKKIWYPTLNIAVITWDKSEWFRDFETILKESWYKYKITVFKSLVHGEKASKEVLEQLNKIGQLQKEKDFNLVAIIRWWGWSEWMNWTNDLELCLTVCDFSIPVMSAVWHTVDQSILDMISCYDCKTPSEASKILIDIYDEFNEDIEAEFEYINNCILDFRAKYKNELNFISKNLPLQISSKVRWYKQKLESFNIDRKIGYSVKLLHSNLDNIYWKIKSNNPDKILEKWYNLVFDKKWKIVKKYEIWEDYLMKTNKADYEVRILRKR